MTRTRAGPSRRITLKSGIKIKILTEIPMTTGRSSKVKSLPLGQRMDGGSSRGWRSSVSQGIAAARIGSCQQGETGSESVGRSETGSKKKKVALILRLGHSVAPLLVLLLLTLMACRPCHGHDPELFDMDDEDGKFHKGIDPFCFRPFSQRYQTATHTISKSFIILCFFSRLFYFLLLDFWVG